MYRLHLQGRKSAEQETSERRCQAGFLLGWFSTLKMQVIYSSVNLGSYTYYRVLYPEDGKFYNFLCENLKSYTLYPLPSPVYSVICTDV
jgi:hypothetical protein